MLNKDIFFVLLQNREHAHLNVAEARFAACNERLVVIITNRSKKYSHYCEGKFTI